jgi:hypothetical protein
MKKDTSLRDLVLGLLFFFGGVYIIFQNTLVTASWGFYLGRFHVSSGMVIIPFLIGIIWKVINPESYGALIVMGLGLLCILLTIIMGVRIHFTTTSLFDYILMFGLTAVGLGFLIKSLFAPTIVKHQK